MSSKLLNTSKYATIYSNADGKGREGSRVEFYRMPNRPDGDVLKNYCK